jgi:hypothetical protein
VSKLDREQMFYLQNRGLTPEQTRSMLLEAFLAEGKLMKTFGTPFQLVPDLMVMWGDRSSCVFSLKHNFDNFLLSSEQKLVDYNLVSLWYLKQEHTAEDKVLIDYAPPGVHLLPDEGDYLITNSPKTGIGIITADCLPIVFLILCGGLSLLLTQDGKGVCRASL